MDRSLEKDLFIKAPSARVFQALSEKEDLESWFAPSVEIDLSPEGPLRFEWGPTMFNAGKILTLEPPRRLSYFWEVTHAGSAILTFELTEVNDGTRLHLIHTGTGEGEDWRPYFDSGWNLHFQFLVAWLETGLVRAW